MSHHMIEIPHSKSVHSAGIIFRGCDGANFEVALDLDFGDGRPHMGEALTNAQAGAPDDAEVEATFGDPE